MTLRLEGVSKSFGDGDVLRDVSLEVPRGSRLALVGASGSGKTTLLRLVAGCLTNSPEDSSSASPSSAHSHRTPP
jgi:ABC-type Fe3+/spermidine/putrescine transport system ATPase subunit